MAICATLLYATRLFKSLWTRATKGLTKTPTTLNTKRKLEDKILKRKSPKEPNFNIIEAKTILPSVGASTWA